ncbi:ROK family transcriptional regulator [Bacillus sp. V2I10]|uniref:ROK family transcriptional regulator n=1 Tax=Bacillus sp. V2I10 TaxID=3042276 RepID=UPI00278A3E10|nr:ROK family transcriptional regulator [Bacillus sp. V2I10]MDQ0862321.1 glucokinase [Bacillus sp. V2I10]
MSFKGIPMHMKSFNKKCILQCIKDQSPISRAEIAVKTKISKPTVSLLVDELINENWVIEKGIGESSSQGGRRPIQLYFNEKAAYIIGTDIGGTNVRTVLCDLGGNIVASCSFATQKYLPSGLLEQLSKKVDGMIKKQNIEVTQVLGMGVGVPGITNTSSGLVIEAPSLNWVQYPFIEEIKQYFSFPVFVDNDVNVACLGEQWLGNAKNKRNVLYISVGTGIGSGIIINNQLYRGSSCAAGEIGYMVTDKNDMKNEFKPVFTHYGYLESVAGGKSIGNKFTDRIKEISDHPMHELAHTSGLTGEDAFKAAKCGDIVALSVIDEANEHLAYGIINAASLLNPEVIIMGGGVLKSSELILPKLQEIMKQYLPSTVELKCSFLGDRSGVLGAVSLFLREYESIIQYS